MAASRGKAQSDLIYRPLRKRHIKAAAVRRKRGFAQLSAAPTWCFLKLAVLGWKIPHAWGHDDEVEDRLPDAASVRRTSGCERVAGPCGPDAVAPRPAPDCGLRSGPHVRSRGLRAHRRSNRLRPAARRCGLPAEDP